MHLRLCRLIGAILVAVLPWQGMAATRVGSCVHAWASTATRDAAAPCHEAASTAGAAAEHETPSGHDDRNACGGCAQCHACCAGILPISTRDTAIPSRSHPVFPPPAMIAGVVLEHLDPPPVG
jgi:hypothetical protein